MKVHVIDPKESISIIGFSATFKLKRDKKRIYRKMSPI